MAHYLQFDGVNDYVVASTWVPTDVENWTIKILCKRNSGTVNGVFFNNSTNTDGMYINHSSGNLTVWAGGASIVRVFPLDTWITVKVECINRSVEVFFDGVTQGSFTQGANMTLLSLMNFGRRVQTGASYIDCSIKYTSLIDPLNSANNRYYDPSATNGTGLTLFDTVGGNHGTLVNFPTDNSQWVEYFDWLNESVDDGLRDYGLKTINSNMYVDFPPITLTGNYFVSLRFIPTSANPNADGLMLVMNDQSSWIGIFSGGIHVKTPDYNTSGGNVIPLPESNREYTLNFYRVGSTVTLEVEGVGVKSFTSVANVSFERFTRVGAATALTFKGYMVSASFNDSTQSRYYDFNQSPNITIAPELIQGLNGTLVGFPAPSGYVKELGSGNEIIGYRFNGSNGYGSMPVITIPAADDFTIELDIKTPNLGFQSYYGLLGKEGTFNPRFQIDFTGNFNFQFAGSANFYDSFTYQSNTDYLIKITRVGLVVKTFVDGVETSSNTITSTTDTLLDEFGKVANGQGYSETIFKRISIISNTISHNYDFTTGDTDQIIDTVGGNHATISSVPTSGYLPIVGRQVFTASDYPQLDTFITAEANSVYSPTYLNGKGKPLIEGIVLVVTWDNLPADFAATVKSNGDDFIIATDPQGANRLPVEKVNYDSATNAFTVWFRTERYGFGENAFWLIYGDNTFTQPAVTDTFGRNNVWQDYVAVHHFAESTLPFIDSTGGGADVTTLTGAVYDSTGLFGGGVFTTESDSSSSISASSTSTAAISDLTLSAWINIKGAVGSGPNTILRFGDDDNSIKLFYRSSPDNFRFEADVNGVQQPETNGTFTLADSSDTWALLHTTSNSTAQSFYANGANDGTFAGAPVTGVQDGSIGVGSNGGQSPMRQTLFAETRISRNVLTSTYIATEYANQSAPNTFWTIGTPEDANGTTFSRRAKLTGNLPVTTIPDLSIDRTQANPLVIDNVTGVNEKLVFTGSTGAVHIKNSKILDIDTSGSTSLITLSNCEAENVSS